MIITIAVSFFVGALTGLLIDKLIINRKLDKMLDSWILSFEKDEREKELEYQSLLKEIMRRVKE